MKTSRLIVALVVALPLWSKPFQAEKRATLSDDEQDLLRDEQNPSKRIEVYLKLEDSRIARLDSAKDDPDELNALLSDYVAVVEEMKSWVQYQFDQQGDMRPGLRQFLARGPQHLNLLRRLEPASGVAPPEYADNLRDAIDDLNDALDGSAKAFSDQQKHFGELKQEEKADARATKERIKEEKKRQEEEKKLRKRERPKGGVPDQDDNRTH
jgi:hypothetical protein